MAFETEVAIIRDARWFVRNTPEYRRFDASPWDAPIPDYRATNLQGAIARACYIHHSRLERITRHLSRTVRAMLMAVLRNEVYLWKAKGPLVLFTQDGKRCYRPLPEVDDIASGFAAATRENPDLLTPINMRRMALDLLDRTLAIIDGHPWKPGPAPVHKPHPNPRFPLLSPTRESWPDDPAAWPPGDLPAPTIPENPFGFVYLEGMSMMTLEQVLQVVQAAKDAKAEPAVLARAVETLTFMGTLYELLDQPEKKAELVKTRAFLAQLAAG